MTVDYINVQNLTCSFEYCIVHVILTYSLGQYSSKGISQYTAVSWEGITQSCWGFNVHYDSIVMWLDSNYRDNVAEEGLR